MYQVKCNGVVRAEDITKLDDAKSLAQQYANIAVQNGFEQKFEVYDEDTKEVLVTYP